MTASPLGELASLTAHLGASSVEAGLGLVPVEIRPGHFRARVPLPATGLRADGRVDPVVLAVAADCGVGVSVNSAVPGSSGGPTAELRLDLAGSAAPSTRALHVEGWALDVGPGAGSGRVEIRDDAGSLVAHGVGVMAIDGSAGAAEAQVGGRFDLADVVVHPRSADGAVAAAPLSAGMVNGMGTVHGGVLTALADLAQECFRDRHGATRPLSLTVEFLRPTHVAAGVLTCHSTFTRRGRRFWAVRTEIRRPDGVPVLRASGTSLVQP